MEASNNASPAYDPEIHTPYYNILLMFPNTWTERYPSSGNSPLVIKLAHANEEASKEVYQPLGEDEIRLVKIHRGDTKDPIRCTVFSVIKGASPDYQALSYIWGDEGNTKTIELNNQSWKISCNLDAAIIQLRREGNDVLVWIDALAINQSDIKERNAQTKKMRDIYASATKTMISLTTVESIEGNNMVYLLKFFEMMENWVYFGSRDISCFKTMMDSETKLFLLVAMLYCVELPYWKRVWVIQEIMYSRDVEILFAGLTVAYDKFVQYLDEGSTAFYEMSKHSPQALHAWKRIKTEGPRLLPAAGSGIRGEYLTLRRWFENHARIFATDPRDKVFGFYGCFAPEIREQIVVDYEKTVKEVLLEFVGLLIKEWGNLDVILEGARIVAKSPDLPSWAPNLFQDNAVVLGLYPYRRLSEERIFTCRASGTHAPNYQFTDSNTTLIACGVHVGIISTTTPPPFDPTSYTEWKEDAKVSFEDKPLLYRRFLDHFRRCWIHFNLTESEPMTQKFISAFFGPFKFPEQAMVDIKRWLPQRSDEGDELMDFIREGHWEIVYTLHRGRGMFSYTAPSSRGVDRTGYGIGAFQAEKGDVLCILLGCAMPVILRRKVGGDYYVFVGDAWVTGVMKGEFMVGEVVDGEEMEELRERLLLLSRRNNVWIGSNG